MHKRTDIRRWTGPTLRLMVFALGGMSAFAGLARAQEAEECLACHADRDLTGTRKGKTISVFVDQKRFGASVHGSLACVTCHADLAGKELPHEEDVKPAVCADCHDAVSYTHLTLPTSDLV